ncbi:hypothetical protein D910_02230 [Dendroctonus ponderosae]
MIAAGSSVEPFWVLYGIHVNDHVFEVLETLRIGNLSKSDIVNVADVGDPYAKDPIRHSALKPANMKPFNAEISPALLCESFITPKNRFQFEGLDLDVTATQYAASIPIWKAVDRRGDVILAYEMNGVPIPPDHGYPIRVVVPGVAGARNVKWLGKIVVSEKESTSHWQQNDYKGFSPSIDYDNVDFSKAPSIQELPVISAICKPLEGEVVKVENGYINLKGYAWSGGGQQIIRVDLTLDEGKTWHIASLDAQDTALPPQHWAWTLWSAKLPVAPEFKEVEIWCKAVDSCYNTQPERFENIWNFRGVLSNAYHRVKIKLNQ